MSLRPTIRNIRASGLTVKGWCAKHGYPYQTVIKILNGYVGKRRIGLTLEVLNRLKKDGHYEEDGQ